MHRHLLYEFGLDCVDVVVATSLKLVPGAPANGLESTASILSGGGTVAGASVSPVGWSV